MRKCLFLIAFISLACLQSAPQAAHAQSSAQPSIHASAKNKAAKSGTAAQVTSAPQASHIQSHGDLAYPAPVAAPQPSFFDQAIDKAGDLVLGAMGHLGIRYKRGGTSPESGFDCSGFVQHVYRNTVGMLLPRTAAEMAAKSTKIDKAELQPGDLVFFNTLKRAFSHVGIYVGDGKFVHAPASGGVVRVESMNMPYWQTRFNGARRVDNAPAAQAATPATAVNGEAKSTPAVYHPHDANKDAAVQSKEQRDAMDALIKDLTRN
jgi:cell wall-associated NlpC family hydrolase